MKLNKTFVIIMAVMCAFALAGTAFADNRVEVKVTSEPVPDDSTCAKGGGFSLEFDTDTVIKGGDEITIDLAYKSSTDNVKLCRNIDLEISNGGSATSWDKTAINSNKPAKGPIYYIDANADDDLSVIAPIYFRLKGTAGSQRITLTVEGTGSITVGNEEADRLVLSFLDQRTNTSGGFPNPGYYIETDDLDLLYNTPAGVLDNTLCINVEPYSESTIKVSMDSEADKYTFIPSDPQIAHIIPKVDPTARDIVTDSCDKVNPGIIKLVSAQGGECKFDYEENLGYCEEPKLDKRRFMLNYKNGTWDAGATYTVTMEIKVDGKSGDNGVYFSSQGIGFGTYDNKTQICDADAAAADTPKEYAAACQTYSCGSTNCLSTNAARMTKATIAANTITADKHYLWVDIPYMVYNSSMVSAGQNVRVYISIGVNNSNSSVCGTSDWSIGPYEVNVGTFGCGDNFSVVFPYMLPKTDGWWSGMTLANMSSKAGKATVYIYEQDGDVGKAEYTVQPKSVMLAMYDGDKAEGQEETLIKAATKTSGTGELGNKPSYVVVCAEFSVDGFAFIGNNELGQGNGYIPRQPTVAPSECQ